MMHEGHNPIHTLWELFCPCSCGICYSCGKAWMEKEIVDRCVHVIIFTLFVPPKPENLFRNRYSSRRNPQESQRSHHKIFQENFNGIKLNLDLLVWLGESLGLCLPLRFILGLVFCCCCYSNSILGRQDICFLKTTWPKWNPWWCPLSGEGLPKRCSVSLLAANLRNTLVLASSAGHPSPFLWSLPNRLLRPGKKT